jgi:protein-L-isoaspartate(D-aspartate) O-methyltransferase
MGVTRDVRRNDPSLTGVLRFAVALRVTSFREMLAIMMPVDRYNVSDMLAAINAGVTATASELGKDALDPRVLDAMAHVPRERFVPTMQRDASYGNFPLPIGFGQTISQPYIVAVMTDLLALAPTARVLEIGTGCGYQTAVLAEIAAEVYSIEIIAELSARAATVLNELGYTNVHLRSADGHRGWPEEAPFDAIIVTAACSCLPPALIKQLKLGANLVAPLRQSPMTQILVVAHRVDHSRAEMREVFPVVFVPMTGAVENQPDLDLSKATS